MSSFGWLDYSDHERRQAMEVIDLFREEETRDELGLGTIRDPLADLLFPGTSTIQTRARYFFFVPWVYADLERRRVPAGEFEHQLRRVQGKLRGALVDGGNETGVIGYRAGLHVQRLPSSVYWAGLRRWGILRYSGSEADFAWSVERLRQRVSNVAVPDGSESNDATPAMWDPHLPTAPKDLFEEVSFALSETEADYVVERVAERFPQSLLAHLLLTDQRVDDVSEFAWEMEWSAAPTRDVVLAVEHARNFSEAMHGAALLYNLLLGEAKPGGEHIGHYREQLDQWAGNLLARRSAFATWNRTDFWQLVLTSGGRTPLRTRQFVDGWLDLVFGQSGIANVAESLVARALITDRERQLKRRRARIGNARAIETWSGAAGSAQLDYRWNRPVKAMINDVLLARAPRARGASGRA